MGITNREVVRRIYDDALNLRNFELLNDLISDEFMAPTGLSGADGFLAGANTVLKALPDAQWEIQELIDGDSKVVVRWKLSGTHLGQFQHIAPTGKKVVNDGMAIFDLKNKKITGSRVMNDRLGFQQAIGALPENPS